MTDWFVNQKCVASAQPSRRNCLTKDPQRPGKMGKKSEIIEFLAHRTPSDDGSLCYISAAFGRLTICAMCRYIMVCPLTTLRYCEDKRRNRRNHAERVLHPTLGGTGAQLQRI
jgi:hypothetical protein